jgi:undecaprenyl-diphosphatase
MTESTLKTKIQNYFEWERKLAINVYSSHSGKGQILYYKLATTIGSPALWWTFLTIFFFRGVMLDEWFEYVSMSGAYVLTMIPYFIIKFLVKRLRPYQVLDEIQPRGYPEKGYSFPSGHSTFGALMYSYIGFVYFDGGLMLIPLFLIALYIGYTRMVLGVHYLTDIIAGVIYGFISGFLYLSFMQELWVQIVYAIF